MSNCKPTLDNNDEEAGAPGHGFRKKFIVFDATSKSTGIAQLACYREQEDYSYGELSDQDDCSHHRSPSAAQSIAANSCRRFHCSASAVCRSKPSQLRL